MKRSNEISEELNNISPLLAGMEKRNVLSVPEGYFDVLSIDVIKKLNSANREAETSKSVSYTHLTLPTICSV